MKKVVGTIFVYMLIGMSSVMAHDFKWDNLMLAAVKLQPQFDYEANVDSYMELYRNDVWNRYRNDEFELQEKRHETIQMMKEKVSSFSLGEEFVIYTKFEFGKYDFKNQLFPLDALSENVYFYDKEWDSGSFPAKYVVYFENPSKVGNIEMNKEEARTFIQRRKSRSGHIDREVGAKLQFVIAGLKNGSNELKAKLTQVTIYSDDERTKMLQKY